MMRNLGGAIGIAALQTFLTKREQFHSNVMTPSRLAVRRGDARPDGLTQPTSSPTASTDPAEAWHEAVVAVGRTVRAQAYFLAFGDTFALLGAGL